MQISGKDWQDLPKPMSLFTARNATMINLNTKEILRHYSANTKIVVVQRCVTAEKTYYRTESAAAQNLNWAFEASAFGLPNEKAPSVPLSTPNKTVVVSQTTSQKQKSLQPADSSKDGEKRKPRRLWRKIFRR